MKHLDLFSGIGGFALAAQRVWGDEHKIMAFCEKEPFCKKILKKHWPDVSIVDDIKNFDTGNFIGTDIITGGFPCTDLSNAYFGSHKDLEGSESSLFFELIRIVLKVNPKWVIIENVPKILKYMDIIRGEMSFYEWDARIFEASEYGALCRKKRAFIVGCPIERGASKVLNLSEKHRQINVCRGQEDILPMCLPWKGGISLERLASCVIENTEDDPTGIREGYGVSSGVDGHRYLALGNAIVPQVAEIIMQSIKEINKSMN